MGLSLLIYTQEPNASVDCWVCFLEIPVFGGTLPRPPQPQPVGGQDGGSGQVLIPERASSKLGLSGQRKTRKEPCLSGPQHTYRYLQL